MSKNKCLINKQIFIDEAKEIIFKSFSDILSLISGTYYPPRSKKVVNLIDRVKKVSFNKSTLWMKKRKNRKFSDSVLIIHYD